MESTYDAEPSTLSSSSAGRDFGAPAIGLRILCHPDLDRIDEVAVLFDPGRVGEARVDRFEPRFRDEAGHDSGPLATPRVSRIPLVREQDAEGTIRVARRGEQSVMLDGRALDGSVALESERVLRGVAIRMGSQVLLWLGPVDASPKSVAVAGLFGGSIAIRRLRDEVARVADIAVPVLLRGETGVGKDLVAHALHSLSRWREGPYVPVNMAAIPGSIASAELFGHAKGAFTGAAAHRPGYFAQADRGTLFLDEIGETAVEVQPILLRVLETGVIQPVGGSPQRVSVRLIAATDSNLELQTREGRFRAPLLHRFGYTIAVPPLRERREDIAGLFKRFLREELTTLGDAERLQPSEGQEDPWLSAAVIERLLSFDWPGNVRQLRNVARRFAVQNRGRPRARLGPELLTEASAQDRAEESQVESEPEADAHVPAAELSDEQIRSALQRNRYSVNSAARELAVSRSWLHAKLPHVPGVQRARDLTREEIYAALEAHGGRVSAAAESLEVSAHALKLQMERLGVR